MEPARNAPTLADLDALPAGIKGEIIEGVLYTMPWPRALHLHVASEITSDLSCSLDFDHQGLDSWWILFAPDIELPGTLEISPAVAGWRRARMPALSDEAAITVVPDWVCEILSPTTREHDLLVKKPYYARIGVAHHWIADLFERTLTAYRLDAGEWRTLGVYRHERDARIEPFTNVALDVGSWWE
jgi:Uma2 family endonuclease